MSQEFLNVLASCEEAAAVTEVGGNWLPPPGDYNCRLSELKSGVKAKDGIDACWLKPIFTIVGGDYDGRQFAEFLHFRSGLTESTPALRSLLTLASLLEGRTVRSSSEAGAIIAKKAQENVMVLVRRVDNPKKGPNGQPGEGVWENVNYVKVIPG